MVWNLHYWIGRKAPKDSSTAAAIRAIQLGEKIGGQAVHYRETQGHESELFQSYFKFNIKYLKGGAVSALNHVTEEVHEIRLLQLLGTRGIVRQVDPHCASLNEGDVFVLDGGTVLWVWVGRKAGLLKKTKGLEIANMINAENKGKGEVKVLEGPTRDQPDNTTDFLALMEGSLKDIADEQEALSNSEVAIDMAESVFLYRVVDVDGEMEAEQIEAPSLVRELLDSEQTYILDCETEIFIWVGKNARWENKASGLMLAEEFLTLFERPAWTPMTRMVEGTETVLFKSKFEGWIDAHPTQDFRELELSKLAAVGRIAPTLEQPPINVLEMHKRVILPDEFIPDEDPDTGIIEIWVVPTGDDKSIAEAVPDDELGEFYCERSYIILYSYERKGQVDSIAYFWGGIRAFHSDYIAYETALYPQVVEKMLAEGAGKPPVKIRYRQYNEGEFFLSLFEGCMMVHLGDGKIESEYRLYDIRGDAHHTRAVELENPKAECLNSAGALVLFTPKRAYKWHGKGCNQVCRDMATHVVDQVFEDGMEEISMEEGEETDEFWTDIGGKGEYANAPYLAKGFPWGYPRLFQGSEATGVFRVDEVLNFSQDDLDELDVMILDGFYEIYLWVGRQSSPKEVNMAIETTKDYIKTADQEGRPDEINLHIIHSGEEPLMFKSFFRGWKDTANLGQIVADEIEKAREVNIQRIQHEASKPASPLQEEFFDVLNKKQGVSAENHIPNGSAPSVG